MTYRVSKGGLISLAIGFLFLSTSCNPVVPASPPPTLLPVTIAYPPSLRLVDEALNSCAQANPGTALLVSEVPANLILEEEADLALWFGEPPETAGFSAPIAAEELVFIVHPDNPVRTLTLEQLSAMLRGEIRNWDEFGDEQVNVWAYPPGNELQLALMEEILHQDPLTSAGYLAPDPLAILEAVSGDPGAIGFLPGAWVNDSIAIVEIEGGESVDLRRPVLALAANTPTGVARTLLACLQSPTGQDVLLRRYEPWIE